LGQNLVPAPGEDAQDPECLKVLCFFNTSTGALVTGAAKVGSALYYFDGENGRLTRGDTDDGWYQAGEDWLYLLENDKLASGQKTLDDKVCYFNTKTGHILTGQVKIGKAYYYFDGKAGRVSDAEQTVVSGAKTYVYYFAKDGKRKTGFVTFTEETKNGTENPAFDRTAEQKAYYTANGLTFGPKKIGGKYYYFNRTDGVLFTDKNTGWIEDLPGATYYCRTETGVLATGKLTVNGKNCYFNSVGKLLTGQIKIGGYYYYYAGKGGRANDAECTVVSGAKTSVFYYAKDGKRKTGLVTFSAETFNGTENPAFDRTEGQKAYYTTNGLTYGAKKIGKYFFYFDRTDGHRIDVSETSSGWITEAGAGARYFIDETKNILYLVTGSKKIGEQYYLFSSSTAAMEKGVEKKVGSHYFYYCAVDNENGSGLPAGARANGLWDLLDGRTVYYNGSSGRISGEKKIEEDWFYFSPTNGDRMTGWITFTVSGKSKTVYGDPATGRLATGLYTVVTKGKSVECYFSNTTRALTTGRVELSAEYQSETANYGFYFDGKNGKVFGKEKKAGSYYNYFRSASQEDGLAGFDADDSVGPAGSIVTGWWKSGSSIKYYRKKTGSSDSTYGQRLQGEQRITPKHSDPSGDAEGWYFFDLSNGALRISATFDYNGYTYKTNSKGEITSKKMKCDMAIETDITVSGTGTGWHGKIAVLDGYKAISFGIQHDSMSALGFPSQDALMFESIPDLATAANPHYQAFKAVGPGKHRIRLELYRSEGVAKGYCDGAFVGQVPMAAVGDNGIRAVTLEAIPRKTGDTANVKFSNIVIDVKGVKGSYGAVGWLPQPYDNNSHYESIKEGTIKPNDGHTYTLYGEGYRLWCTAKIGGGDWDSVPNVGMRMMGSF
jgi:glucan-binding YG repeat protein